MITKNLKNAYLAKGSRTDYINQFGKAIRTSISYTYILNPSYADKIQADAYIGNYNTIVAVGNGTTLETETDYRLESLVTTLTNDSTSITENIESNGEVGTKNITITATFSNNTTTDVVISEVGIYYSNLTGGYINKSSDQINDSILLFYRKTFEPITLAPNDTYTFVIKLM